MGQDIESLLQFYFIHIDIQRVSSPQHQYPSQNSRTLYITPESLIFLSLGVDYGTIAQKLLIIIQLEVNDSYI